MMNLAYYQKVKLSKLHGLDTSCVAWAVIIPYIKHLAFVFLDFFGGTEINEFNFGNINIGV